MIEWRIIANKTRKCRQKKYQDTMTTNIVFWNKATSKSGNRL